MSDCLDALGRHVRQARADVLFDGLMMAIPTGCLLTGVWTGWLDRWLITVLIVVVMCWSSLLTLQVNRWRFWRLAYRAHQAGHSVEQRRVAAPWN